MKKSSDIVDRGHQRAHCSLVVNLDQSVYLRGGREMSLEGRARGIGVFICFAIAIGCGPSFTEALKKGEELPVGKVLVVGKVVLEPSFETMGKKKVDEEPLDIQIGLTADLSKQVKEGEIYLPDEAIAPVLGEAFFFPLSSGGRYIRSGQIMKVVGHHINGPAAGSPIYEVLRVYRNIRLDIPDKARVVYIGTIVYRHDGKRATSVSVRDDYDSAARELAKMKLSGFKGGMTKKLAAVVK
jgi:hypothetical protein